MKRPFPLISPANDSNGELDICPTRESACPKEIIENKPIDKIAMIIKLRRNVTNSSNTKDGY